MSLLGWVLVYSGALVRRGNSGIQRETKNSPREKEQRSCSDTGTLTSGELQGNYH